MANINNTPSFGDVFDNAAVLIRLYPKQLILTVLTRILYASSVVAVIWFGFFVILPKIPTDTGNGISVSLYFLAVVSAILFFLTTFFNMLTTAANTLTAENGKFFMALAGVFLNIPKLFIYALIQAVIFLSVIITLALAAAALLDADKLIAAFLNRNFSLVNIYVLGFVLLLSAAVYLFFSTLFYLCVPFALFDNTSIFSFKNSISAVCKKGSFIRFVLFNALYKLFVTIIYFLIFFSVSNIAAKPAFLEGIPEYSDILNTVYRAILTYFAATLFVPFHKNVVFSLYNLFSTKPQQRDEAAPSPRFGSKTAALLIDITVQVAILLILVYNAVLLMAQNNDGFVFSLKLAPSVWLIMIILFTFILSVINVLIKKTLDGRFIGKHLMQIGFVKNIVN